MAKKLAPLVIPAVIDTSGIDKGVSNIKNKLGRAGKGSTTIGGGGPGFSSGIIPHGMPLGGGASSVATAVAAAFGASAAQRVAGWQSTARTGGMGWSNPNIVKMSRADLAALRSSTFIGRQFMNVVSIGSEMLAKTQEILGSVAQGYLLAVEAIDATTAANRDITKSMFDQVSAFGLG